MKMNFFGPMFGVDDPENHFEVGAPATIIKKVTANLNNNKYSVTVDPFSASATETHSIVEGWSPRVAPTDFDVGKTV